MHISDELVVKIADGAAETRRRESISVFAALDRELRRRGITGAKWFAVRRRALQILGRRGGRKAAKNIFRRRQYSFNEPESSS